jgi:hypothetical protein
MRKVATVRLKKYAVGKIDIDQDQIQRAEFNGKTFSASTLPAERSGLMIQNEAWLVLQS